MICYYTSILGEFDHSEGDDTDGKRLPAGGTGFHLPRPTIASVDTAARKSSPS